MKLRKLLLGLASTLLVACSGGASDFETIAFSIPNIPLVGTSTTLSDGVGTGAEVPGVDEPTNELLLRLLANCEGRIVEDEAQVLATAVRSRRHENAIRWSLALYEQVIATDGRLIGRDMRTRYLAPGDVADTSGAHINVIAASSVPGLPTFNAFALENVVVMLDPLMDAMMESAAYWDLLLEHAGGDQSLIDADDLMLGFGVIFEANSKGAFGTLVPPQEVRSRIENRPFAFEAYWGSVAYILFHELGHANLEHSLAKCLVSESLDSVLADAGIIPTPAQRDDLDAALLQLSRGTETQADIYAAALSETMGFSSNGAGIMVMGFLGLNLVSGECESAVGDEQLLEECILDRDELATHPPLDIRAEIATSTIDDKVDYTGLLQLVNALRLGAG